MKKKVIFNLVLVVLAFGGLWYWLSTKKLVGYPEQADSNNQKITDNPNINAQIKDTSENSGHVVSDAQPSKGTGSVKIPERNNQIVTSDTPQILGLKQSFSKKYNKSIDSVTVTIDSALGGYIKGTVDFDNSNNPVYFYAYNKEEIYTIVVVENGVMSCSSIAGYAFPTSMIPECYSSSSGTVVSR